MEDAGKGLSTDRVGGETMQNSKVAGGVWRIDEITLRTIADILGGRKAHVFLDSGESRIKKCSNVEHQLGTRKCC